MFIRLSTMLACILAVTTAVRAQPLLGLEPKAKVELVVAADVVRPGDSVPIGIKFTMQPDWHIYWQNPGDAGTPPSFNWNLPDGFQATAPEFPTPIAFESAGLVGYGYAKTIVFPATLNVPQTLLPRGGELTVAVDYLICDDDTCVPESAVATANVTFGSSTELKPDVVAEIEAAKARLPQDIKPLTPITDTIAFSAANATDVGLFPLPPGDVEVTIGEAVEQDDSAGVTVVIPIKARKFGGGDVAPFPVVVGFTDADGNRRGHRLIVDPANATE
ncbi:MAG: protein-disulfide reductase DsbD domain-containing protein [Planctomycetota bacterium]